MITTGGVSKEKLFDHICGDYDIYVDCLNYFEHQRNRNAGHIIGAGAGGGSFSDPDILQMAYDIGSKIEESRSEWERTTTSSAAVFDL